MISLYNKHIALGINAPKKKKRIWVFLGRRPETRPSLIFTREKTRDKKGAKGTVHSFQVNREKGKRSDFLQNMSEKEKEVQGWKKERRRVVIGFGWGH